MLFRSREGQPPSRCAFLVEGYAYRQKLTIDGHRTICSLEVPGDFVDLQNIYLRESDHDVLALTDVISVDIPVAEMRVLAETAPAVGRAMWVDGLIEGAIFREWLLNIGRRNARSRVAHILCEFSTRLQAAGLAPELTADLPMTQEQLGDALGLTSVHVNRILRTMEAEGLVTRGKRQITITDWQGIRRVATATWPEASQRPRASSRSPVPSSGWLEPIGISGPTHQISAASSRNPSTASVTPCSRISRKRFIVNSNQKTVRGWPRTA